MKFFIIRSVFSMYKNCIKIGRTEDEGDLGKWGWGWGWGINSDFGMVGGQVSKTNKKTLKKIVEKI